MSESAKAKPVQTHRRGSLSVSIWAREHDGETFYSTTAQRAFKNKADEWDYSDSFNRDDLPVVALLMQRAWATICQLENAAKDKARA